MAFRRAPHQPTRECGFTLPELLAALGILSLLLASGATLSRGFLARQRLEASAQNVAAALRATRAQATRAGATRQVAFDVVGGRYLEIETGRLRTLPRGIRFVTPTGGPAVTFERPVNGEPSAEFSPRGRLRSRTTPAHAHVGIAEQGVFFRVSVGVLGVVSIERWANGSWR